MSPHRRRMRRCAFNQESRDRWEKLVESGEVISWEGMKQFLHARVAGEKTEIPVVRKRLSVGRIGQA